MELSEAVNACKHRYYSIGINEPYLSMMSLANDLRRCLECNNVIRIGRERAIAERTGGLASGEAMSMKLGLDAPPSQLERLMALYAVGRDKNGRARGRVLITKRDFRKLMEEIK